MNLITRMLPSVKKLFIKAGRKTSLRHCIVITVLLTLISTNSFGQVNNQIDSLMTLLEQHQEKDTIRLNLLLQVAKLNINNETDEGIEFRKEALHLAKSLNGDRTLATAYYFLGISHDDLHEYETAMQYYDTAISHFQELEMMQYLAYCLSKMSVIHRIWAEFDEAMSTVVRASEINRELDNLLALGYNLDNMGTISGDIGELDQALDYYEQGLEIRKMQNDTLAISQSMLSISLVLVGHGKYDKALQYSYEALANFEHLQDTLSIAESIYLIGCIKAYNYEFKESVEDLERALTMFRAIDERFMIMIALTTMANCLAEMDDMETSIVKYEEALSIAEEYNFTADKALILSNLAYYYAKLENYEVALDYGNKALELEKAINVQTEGTLRTIADIYFKMKDFDHAIEYANKALSLYEDDERYHEIALSHQVAYQAYEAKGSYKEAFEHLKKYMAAEDSLYNVEKSTEIANLTSIHDLKEQESENELLRLNQELDEATIKRQNFLIIGAILAIVVLAALAFTVYRGLVQRRRMSSHLTELNEQLNQSNDKLKDLNDYRTRLFANINHDFRTPLTLIKGYTNQISTNKDNYLTQASENDLKNLQKNTSVLTQMTAEIQNLLLLEEGKLELTWSEIQLLPMLKLIVNMFDSKVVQQRKTLKLSVEINDDLVIHADKLYFKKILFNLISNAIKHTQPDDIIVVTARSEEDQVVFQINDSGDGIDENYLPHIFDRFYQAPQQPYASKEGFGIGLSLVKELVTLHGGQISVESKMRKGTTFEFILPLNLDKITSKETPHADQEMLTELPVTTEQAINSYVPSLKEKTVLIVDDHEEIRSYIGSILNEDYDLAFAGHGKQALEILATNRVDLIITDLMMPWLDGFELIEQLSADEKLKNIPVVVVSARTAEVDKRMILEAGVNDFITKPFDADDLRKRVHNRIHDTEIIKTNAWQIIANNKDLTSNVEESIIKKINQLIIDRIDDPNLTVEEVANEINASRSKTFRLIKELTNKSPKAYIKDIRLEYVHELLKNGKIKNASEGARAIGMLNGTEFKNQYLHKYGDAAFDL